MSDFVRYQHVERIGLCGKELDGLLNGEVYVFPKIDGANHCVYFDKDLDRVAIASRNQLLSEGYDSTGFWHFVNAHPDIERFVLSHRSLRVYGEYLTPHTVKNYRDDAWNKWYVFDIWDDERGRWLDYNEIEALSKEMCSKSADILCIPYITKHDSPSVDELLGDMDKDTFLLKEGTQGEGIVVKNYDYTNPYGRRTWGKIIREGFGAKSHGKTKEACPEVDAVRGTMSDMFVSKEFHKFTDDAGVVWSANMISDFLKYIWKEWWTDNSFTTLAGLKTVDMKAVRKAVISETMRLLNRIVLNEK